MPEVRVKLGDVPAAYRTILNELAPYIYEPDHALLVRSGSIPTSDMSYEDARDFLSKHITDVMKAERIIAALSGGRDAKACEACNGEGIIEVMEDSGTDAPPHSRDEQCQCIQKRVETDAQKQKGVIKAARSLVGNADDTTVYPALEAALDALSTEGET